MPDNSYKILH